MASLGFSLQPRFSPAAAPLQIPLFRSSSLSAGVSSGDQSRTGTSARRAIPQKPAAQIDAVGSNKESLLPAHFHAERAPQAEETAALNKIEKISGMLRSMTDGDISISAYDTAWVALVPSVDGGGGPQFPESLEWIENNQLDDGSWGDDRLFVSHDRLINTLACVIALETWGAGHHKCRRGIAFLAANMGRLDEEDVEHMPIGFEVAFPSLVEIAGSMDLNIPFDCAGLEEIHKRKALKMKRIPKDVLHQVPTTLLHSLEGMTGLDWEKILRLQCADGSLLFSPSSTAFALMCTGDANCLDYLQRIVRRFNGGVPNVYPVDLFERLWAVDRLERLGVSRYFGEEIRRCLDYVYGYWTENGISWARASNIQDVDDTAMGFRLLRLHGYDVAPDVFKQFEKDGEFFCLPGQSTQAVTGMYNLNRAAQLSYTAELILQEARRFSFRYLRERRALNKLTDKWIITKDLPGEVGYALDFPWHASLPRVEARLYLEHYGGESDVWIGKTLYRMACVNNEDFLELAKVDFDRCQSLHRIEWFALQRWFVDSGVNKFGVSKEKLLSAYFLAAASIFEPERSAERLGWTRTAVLAEALSSHLTSCGGELDLAFSAFVDGSILYDSSLREDQGILGCLSRLLDLLSSEAQPLPAITRAQLREDLCRAWNDWFQLRREGEDDRGFLLVRSIELCAGRTALEDSLPASTHAQSLHLRLARLVSSLSRRLLPHSVTPDDELDPDMQDLVMLVISNGSFHGDRTMQTFLAVARSIYYVAICSPATFQCHIDKVLFEDVL